MRNTLGLPFLREFFKEKPFPWTQAHIHEAERPGVYLWEWKSLLCRPCLTNFSRQPYIKDCKCSITEEALRVTEMFRYSWKQTTYGVSVCEPWSFLVVFLIIYNEKVALYNTLIYCTRFSLLSLWDEILRSDSFNITLIWSDLIYFYYANQTTEDHNALITFVVVLTVHFRHRVDGFSLRNPHAIFFIYI